MSGSDVNEVAEAIACCRNKLNEQDASSSSHGCPHGGLKGLLGKSLANIRLSKSEQKKAEREEELVDLAVSILNEDGFGGMSLEKLAAQSCYSKGTIYNHFSSKEDCLSALCIRAVSFIMTVFKRALEFKGCSREKTSVERMQLMDALELEINALANNTTEATAVNRLNPNTVLLQNISILLDI